MVEKQTKAGNRIEWTGAGFYIYDPARSRWERAKSLKQMEKVAAADRTRVKYFSEIDLEPGGNN